MNWPDLAFILTTAALALVGVSVWAGPNLPVALLFGGAGALLAAVLATFAFWERVHRPRTELDVPETDPLVELRSALSSGPLGRETIVFAVQAIEGDLGVRTRPPIGPAEQRALLDLPADGFRTWLSERLDRLEKET